MAKYPIYLEVAGKRVVIIGAGSVASRKAKSLCKAGAKVTIVAKQIQPEFLQRCKGLDLNIVENEYSKEYLHGAVIVIAATNDNELNSRIYTDCNDLNILCNVVDVPEYCDFYVPALIQQGPLQIAIGTDGNSPAYAGKIRRQLQTMFGPEHGKFITEMGAVRKRVIAEIADADIRKRIFESLVEDESFEYYVKYGSNQWQNYAAEIIQRELQHEN